MKISNLEMDHRKPNFYKAVYFVINDNIAKHWCFHFFTNQLQYKKSTGKMQVSMHNYCEKHWTTEDEKTAMIQIEGFDEEMIVNVFEQFHGKLFNFFHPFIWWRFRLSFNVDWKIYNFSRICMGWFDVVASVSLVFDQFGNINKYLCFFGSSALLERIFANVDKKWKKESSALSIATLKWMLFVKINMNYSCTEFSKFLKTRLELLREISSKEKYNFKQPQQAESPSVISVVIDEEFYFYFCYCLDPSSLDRFHYYTAEPFHLVHFQQF